MSQLEIKFVLVLELLGIFFGKCFYVLFIPIKPSIFNICRFFLTCNVEQYIYSVYLLVHSLKEASFQNSRFEIFCKFLEV